MDGITAALSVVIVILLFILAVGPGGLDDDLLRIVVVDLVLPHYGLDLAPLDVVVGGGLIE